MASLILAGLVHAAFFFAHFGYLPDPFFSDPSDTFMDWYYPAYWAHHKGAYDVYFSVYPPLSFLFQRLVSLPGCYISPAAGRTCDYVGVITLVTTFIVNLALVFLTFRREGLDAAAPRTIAVGLGIPMLYALERGNLIIPCFTLFVLAYGNLVKSPLLRVGFAAAVVNFKPYLILMGVGPTLRRDWRWAEYFGILTLLIYLASYVAMQDGSLIQIVRNTIGFSTGLAATASLRSLHFTTSYTPLLYYLNHVPLVTFLGTRPIELANFWIPLLLRLEISGTCACLLMSILFPKCLSAQRIALLILTAYSVIGGPGGYALGFVLFLLFMEEFPGVFGRIAILCAYLWCIPWDVALQVIYHRHMASFLSGHLVFQDVTVPAGDVVRPAFMVILGFSLIVVTLGGMIRRPWQTLPTTGDQ